MRTKTHEVPPHGYVLRVVPEDDYGFLRSGDGLDVYFYFHRNAVVGRFDDLEPGTRVRYALAEGEGERGPQASSVVPIGKHHLPDVDRTPSQAAGGATR